MVPAVSMNKVINIAAYKFVTLPELLPLRARLLALCREIALKSTAERARVACIGSDRAELIVAGCAIVDAILSRWPGGGVRIADRGIREGILRTLMGRDGVWAAGR